MQRRPPVQITYKVAPTTPEQERDFYAAFDQFLEALVRGIVERRLAEVRPPCTDPTSASSPPLTGGVPAGGIKPAVADDAFPTSANGKATN